MSVCQKDNQFFRIFWNDLPSGLDLLEGQKDGRIEVGAAVRVQAQAELDGLGLQLLGGAMRVEGSVFGEGLGDPQMAVGLEGDNVQVVDVAEVVKNLDHGVF